jgi:hypothetical protein
MEAPDWFDESQFVPTPADRLPAADIDELFEQAFDNPGYRAEFNRRLPDSDLWVLVDDVPSPEDAVGGYMPIRPLHLNDGSMALFTAEARIRDAQDLPKHIRWVQIRARELLEQMTGVDFVLNPFSPKQFNLSAEGVSALLTGDLREAGLSITESPMPESDEVVIKTDKEFPVGMVEALQTLLSQHPRVVQAYLVYLMADGPDRPNRYHMRLELEGEEVHQLMLELQPVLRAFMQPGEGFELLSKVGDDADDNMVAYLRQLGPIYERV